ncbi:MAG: phenylacetate--CoA ligase family protein [Chthonomonadales bacterium]
MANVLLSLYHRMPPVAKSWVASWRGRQLWSLRYGADTDAIVKAALDRESWSPQEWRAYQEERLRYMLRLAREHVGYYRAYWDESRRHKEGASPEELNHWPILRKEEVRREPGAFRVEGLSRRGIQCVHTSGSTGTPLALWRDRAANRQWYGLFEARVRRWHGLSRMDRWAIIGGQLVTPIEQKHPPFWVWNAGLRQLYLSAYHLAPGTAKDYARALGEYRVRYLYGYASALYALAELLNSECIAPPQLSAVISNAEPLYAHQREVLARVFGCAVRDTYGTAEMMPAASECEAGTLHLWPEACVLEVLSDESDEPVPPGTVGRFVCTGLMNEAMPLIRYEIGDRGALAPDDFICPCGRRLPALLTVEGRLDDVIFTPDGRRIGRLDPVFKADLPITEAQIIQEDARRLVVRYVPALGFKPHHAEEIAERLRQRVGEMAIHLEPTRSIPRGANGKFRTVINRMTRPAE